jgi:hypothetical protein
MINLILDFVLIGALAIWYAPFILVVTVLYLWLRPRQSERARRSLGRRPR